MELQNELFSTNIDFCRDGNDNDNP